MRTSKKKHKHTPHIVRNASGKFYPTTWGNPFLTKEQKQLHEKAQNYCLALNFKV